MKVTNIHPDDEANRLELRAVLTQARRDAGLTQVQLGHIIGHARRGSVAQMEHGVDWETPTAQTWAWGVDHQVVFEVQGLPVPPPDPLDGVCPPDPRLADEYDRQRLIDHILFAVSERRMSWAELGRRIGRTDWAARKWFTTAHRARLSTAQRMVRALDGVLLLQVVPLLDADADAPRVVVAA